MTGEGAAVPQRRARRRMSARNLLLTSFGALIAALRPKRSSRLLEAREGAALRQAEDRRHASYRLADQLRQSSDELTRFARTYAATGDARFKEYFELVLKIRDGKAPRPEGYEGIYWDFVASTHQKPALVGRPVALLDLMRSEGFQPAEFAKIAEAKALSDELVSLEAQAMEAMEGEPDQATRPSSSARPGVPRGQGRDHAADPGLLRDGRRAHARRGPGPARARRGAGATRGVASPSWPACSPSWPCSPSRSAS